MSDLESMNEVQLRERHTELTAKIAELNAKDGGLTIAEAREKRTMVAEANEIVKAVAELGDVGEPEEIAEVVKIEADPNKAVSQAAEAIAAAAATDTVEQAQVANRPIDIDRKDRTAPLRASADIPNIPQGTELRTIEDLARAYGARARGAGTGRSLIASASWLSQYDEDSTIGRGDAGNATAKLKSAQAEARRIPASQPLTAAVGLCGPGDVDYGVTVTGMRGTPIWDVLPKRAAVHGKINFRPPLVSSAGHLDGPFSIAQDVSGSEYPKNCPDTDCATFISAEVYAISSCRKLSNFSERFDPDMVQGILEQDLVDLDADSEVTLFSKMQALATTQTVVATYGAGPTWINTLNKIAVYLQSRSRTRAAVRVIAPWWTQASVEADLVNSTFGADVRQFLDNVRITYDMPGDLGYNTAGGGHLPAYPSEAHVIAYIDGDFVGLDGGTLDLGFVRDSTLNVANRVQHFIEVFQGVAFIGKEATYAQIPLCEDGTRAPAGTKLACPVQTGS